MQSLYVHRPLLNADEVIAWAKTQGFNKTLTPDDMHVTVMYSKAQVDWNRIPKSHIQEVRILSVQGREVCPLGDQGAVVLKFKSQVLSDRWKEFKDLGCSWDYPSYQAHTTITYDGSDLNLNKIVPWMGKLIFGPEIWAPLDENWKAKEK